MRMAMAAAAGLGVDEVIELGQERPPESATPTELGEIRGVIDAWIARYSREVNALVGRQSRLAQETGESMFRLWLQEWGATLGVVAHPAEIWEATRLVAFRLLSVGQRFAQEYHPYFTDEQERLLSMLMDSALKSIDLAEQFSRALRPEILSAVEKLIRGTVQVLADVSLQLGEILKKVGLTALALPDLGFDLVKWLKDHLGLVIGIGAGVLALAVIVPVVVKSAAASQAMSGPGLPASGRIAA